MPELFNQTDAQGPVRYINPEDLHKNAANYSGSHRREPRNLIAVRAYTHGKRHKLLLARRGEGCYRVGWLADNAG